MNKPSQATCQSVINAIDKYIAKADDDLARKLKKRGYLKTKESVKVANEIEDGITEEFHSDTMELISALKQSDSVEDYYNEEWGEYKDEHSKSDTISLLLGASMLGLVSTLSTSYMQQNDPQLEVEELSERTTSFIDDWSKSLGEKVKTDRLDQLENTLLKGLDDGSSVDKMAKELFDNEIREEYYQCKRIALTEVLRAHSMSQLEAIQQDPSVTHKVWRHTGGGMTSRPNHVAIDGQTVPKFEPFTLIGADGFTYNPSMPHDPSLPPGESINCHCMLERVTDESILGLSLEERQAMRDEARESISDEWKYELDNENKARAGINEETIKLDWIKQKSQAGQIKYLGSKIKYELVDMGAIKNDSDLFKTVKTSSGKITVQKTLQEIRQSGIITVTPTEKAEYAYYSKALGKNAPESIENYVKLRSNPSEWNIFVPYAKSIETGDLTPLADFDLYKNQRNEIYSKLVGTVTSDGLKITGSTYHYIDRTIGSVEQKRSGVDVDTAYKALTEPVAVKPGKISDKGNSAKYVYDKCLVSVNNKTGKLIQVNPINTKGIKKMANFKIEDRQIELLKKYAPDIYENLEIYTHINDFLIDLDDKIIEIGYTDETYDYLNETGRILERLYDQVFNQNEES